MERKVSRDRYKRKAAGCGPGLAGRRTGGDAEAGGYPVSALCSGPVATRDQACLAYYAFDLLYLDGRDLCSVAQERRKEMLIEIIGEGEWNLRAIDHIRGRGPEFFLAACQQKLEGIVSKKADSSYRPGTRSKEWLKVKGGMRRPGKSGGSGGRSDAGCKMRLLKGKPEELRGALDREQPAITMKQFA